MAAPSNERDIFVTVSDPEKHGDGLDAYVSYKVATKTTRTTFQSKEFYVRRRYQDFVWLHTRLEETCPASIVPPLPEKHVMKRMARFSPEFLEKRRVGLQKFVDRVAAHPILSSNGEFQTFLEAATWEMASAKKRGGGLLASLGESFKNLAAKMILKNPDDRFVALNDYFKNLAEKLSALEKINASLAKNKSEYATDLAEMGAAFKLVADLETEICSSSIEIANGLEKISSVCKESNIVEDEGYVFPLQEYLQYTESVLTLLKRRDALQLHCELVMEELDRKRQEKENTLSSDGKKSFSTMLGKDPAVARQEKLDKLEQQIAELELLVEKANDENLSTNESILSDVERWRANMKEDFKAVFKTLFESQAKQCQETLALWEGVLPSLEAIEDK